MKLNNAAVGYGFQILGSYGDAVIVLYEGNQPSINDFVANFSTNYNRSGVNTLQIYNTYSLFSRQGWSENSTRFLKTSGPDITYSKQSIRSGTASWAAIFYQNSDAVFGVNTLSNAAYVGASTDVGGNTGDGAADASTDVGGTTGDVGASTDVGGDVGVDSGPSADVGGNTGDVGVGASTDVGGSTGDGSSTPTTITDDTKFIIVPVSNLSGLGILKLRTTTVMYSSAPSDNLIADFILDIYASFTVTSPTTTAAPTTTTTTAAPVDAGPGSDTGGTGASTDVGGNTGDASVGASTDVGGTTGDVGASTDVGGDGYGGDGAGV